MDKAGYINLSKITGVIVLVGIGWLKIPLSFPGAVKNWNDNYILPQIFLWCMIFGAIAIFLRRKIADPALVTNRAGRWIIGVIPLVFLWILPWGSAYQANMFFVFSLIVLFLIIAGKRWIRAVGPSIAFVLLSPGLPSVADGFIIARLQDYGSWATIGYCKRVLSANYTRNGNMIYQPQVEGPSDVYGRTRIMVAKECSGYRSLAGMSLVALLYAADPKLRALAKIIIFLFAVAAAVGFNTLRLFMSTTFIHYNYRNLANQDAHALFGNVFMIVEVIMLYYFYGYCLKKQRHVSVE